MTKKSNWDGIIDKKKIRTHCMKHMPEHMEWVEEKLQEWENGEITYFNKSTLGLVVMNHDLKGD